MSRRYIAFIRARPIEITCLSVFSCPPSNVGLRLGSSNDTSQPFYEHLLDNEVRLHGGFYSKEPELDASLPKRDSYTDYLNRWVNETKDTSLLLILSVFVDVDDCRIQSTIPPFNLFEPIVFTHARLSRGECELRTNEIFAAAALLAWARTFLLFFFIIFFIFQSRYFYFRAPD